MKKLEISFHKQDNGNYAISIDTEGHVTLSTAPYTNGGNHVDFTLFDLTEDDIKNLQYQLSKAIGKL